MSRRSLHLGGWHLALATLGLFDLGKILSPEGILIVSAYIPLSVPPGCTVPLQASIGAKLTNLCVPVIK